jgi:hypothetical protein
MEKAPQGAFFVEKGFTELWEKTLTIIRNEKYFFNGERGEGIWHGN